jgi:hypothetical protein
VERDFKKPMTDQDCEAWLETARLEAVYHGFSADDVNEYFKENAPDAVLNYLLRQSGYLHRMQTLPEEER